VGPARSDLGRLGAFEEGAQIVHRMRDRERGGGVGQCAEQPHGVHTRRIDADRAERHRNRFPRAIVGGEVAREREQVVDVVLCRSEAQGALAIVGRGNHLPA
jgi:hypothetical protein